MGSCVRGMFMLSLTLLKMWAGDLMMNSTISSTRVATGTCELSKPVGLLKGNLCLKFWNMFLPSRYGCAGMSLKIIILRMSSVRKSIVLSLSPSSSELAELCGLAMETSFASSVKIH